MIGAVVFYYPKADELIRAVQVIDIDGRVLICDNWILLSPPGSSGPFAAYLSREECLDAQANEMRAMRIRDNAFDVALMPITGYKTRQSKINDIARLTFE